MKKIVLVSLIALMSCKEKQKVMITDNFNVIENQEKNMNDQEDKIIDYIVHTSTPFVARGQVIVNDMVCYTESNDNMTPLVYLNYYLLPNQKQKVSFEISAQKNPNLNDKFNMAVMTFFNDYFEIGRFVRINGETDKKQTQFFKKPVLDEKNPLAYYKLDWEFELLEPLNFKMKGWSDGQDLRSLDKDVLEKLVYEKFKQLHKLLNSGKGEEFVKELELSIDDYCASQYYAEENKQEFKANMIESYSMLKGHVLPLEGCIMRIMGDGKVVALERTDKYLGHGALLAIDDGEANEIYKNYIMLYLPPNSKELKVIRHESTIEMYEYRPKD